MTSLEKDFKKIAALACIEMDAESAAQLEHDVAAIIRFATQLDQIDTTNVLPLLHPLELEQRLRSDEADEPNHVAALGSIAPLFEHNLYCVPKVIVLGK